MLLIVTEDGSLLLHHRDDNPKIPNPDCWAGFGGAVETGETIEDAVRREVREETGLQIADPIFLTEAVDHEGDGRTVSLFYMVGGVRPEDIDLQEGAGIGVHTIEDLPSLKITPFVRRAIYAHLLPVILTAKLTAFMAGYERAANSHDVQQVLPLIADDAVYWFTDGSYRGREEIAGALERTFATIQDEVYEIRELEWLAMTDEFAACRYRFFWRGVVDGQPSSGRGRGTNVLVKQDGSWRVRHEHLSGGDISGGPGLPSLAWRGWKSVSGRRPLLTSGRWRRF
jgi:ADP-ribose pyrophosphatase YjhB (NUDIX family)